MDTANNILETIKMTLEDRLGVRIVMMGISFLDCVDSDGRRARGRCYERIVKRVADPVPVCEAIEAELGILIINKRISIIPIAPVTTASREFDLTPWVQMLDETAAATGVDFIGGFPALVEKRATVSDLALIDSIPEALSSTKVVCLPVNVGPSRAGINMDAARAMGETITVSVRATENGLGAAKLVALANSVGNNPFMVDALHGVEMPDCVVSTGVSGPGVVTQAIASAAGEPSDALTGTVKKSALKITRMGELVGCMAAECLGVDFGVVDLFFAPTSEIGDSVACAPEVMGLERVGTHGTTAALALLNDAVKRGGLMACSRVGGLSRSFVPVFEGEDMIEVAGVGAISLAKLEAVMVICSVDLDMAAVPGDTPSSTIAGMIASEAAIGVMNHKTTAVRIIPAPGTASGGVIESGGLLGRASVMPVSPYSNEVFTGRGGFMPALVHGLKNRGLSSLQAT